MTIGRRKNLAVFAKQIALTSKTNWFGTDWNQIDFFRVMYSSAIRIIFSEMSFLKEYFSFIVIFPNLVEFFFIIFFSLPNKMCMVLMKAIKLK